LRLGERALVVALNRLVFGGRHEQREGDSGGDGGDGGVADNSRAKGSLARLLVRGFVGGFLDLFRFRP
jgi:hypothetical protein